MNETQAWNCFARSGRVEDYLRYVQVRSIDHREEVLRGREETEDPGAYPSGDGPGR